MSKGRQYVHCVIVLFRMVGGVLRLLMNTAKGRSMLRKWRPRLPTTPLIIFWLMDKHSSAPSTSSSSVSQKIATDTGFKPMINMMDRVSNSEVRLNLFQLLSWKKILSSELDLYLIRINKIPLPTQFHFLYLPHLIGLGLFQEKGHQGGGGTEIN